MSELNRRLERIENQVESLLERQRISRFDNLMLLVYPLVILGLTVLTNAIQPYATASRDPATGPLETITLYIAYYGGIFFVLLMVVPFIQFIHAYAVDDLRGRVSACGLLSMFPVGLLIIVIAMPRSWAPIIWLAVKGPEPLLILLLFTSTVLSPLCFSIASGRWVERRLISWFERNAWLAFAATRSVRLKRGRRLTFSEYGALLEMDMKSALCLGKILWCASCLIYAAMVVGAIWVSGQFEFVTYYVAALTALLIVTPLIVSRRVRSLFHSE